MANLLESLIVRTWNTLTLAFAKRIPRGQLRLGYIVEAGTRTNRFLHLYQSRRPEHVVILGKTGTGKSSLLRFLCAQDVRRQQSFIFFDLHGDATPMLLRLIAAEERRRGVDLSGRVIVFDPADRDCSIGINVLEVADEQQRYVEVADLAQILRDRWRLDTLGVRTEELLRNALHILIDNHFTLIELGPLLVDPAFRTRCLANARNVEAIQYFRTRYNVVSEPMQALYREAVLNKVTVFTSDPHFRHLLGQSRSTVNLRQIVEGGYWLIFNLNKGRLGEQAATLGSLLLTKLRHTLFGRQSRSLLTLYCDELQNLVAYDGGIESLFSEARKLKVSVTSANQYLNQYPASMQAAVLAAGTLIFFQLSVRDAGRIAVALGGGRHLRQQIANLPPRETLVKRSGDRPRHVRVPDLPTQHIRADSLRRRSNRRFARERSVIESEIEARLGTGRQEVLDGWE